MALGVDAVVIGIALEQEIFRRRRRGIVPGIERRKSRIFLPVGARAALVQGYPVLDFARLDGGGQRGFFSIMLMELLQVMGRLIKVQRLRAGQRGEKTRVGRVPAVAHGSCVQHFELRMLAMRQHLLRRAFGIELLVVCHMIPKIAEIFRRERLPVGPFVARAQMQSKNAAFGHLVAFEQIGHQLHGFVKHQQPRVAIESQQPEIALVADQHAQSAAVLADFAPDERRVGDARMGRNALRHGRQRARLHAFGKHRHLDHGHFARLCRSAHQQAPDDNQQHPHATSSRRSLLSLASTKWPSPRSIIVSPRPSER